ncbi:MAG: hypothetical protein HY902_06090 [Deltaproteobacteria bacterium]|nr:hypothetical protein [Deltaproteobacteria bacterium]
MALREAASRPSWHPDVALMATAAQMGQFTIDRTGAKSPKNADLYGRLHFGVGGQTGRWLGRLLVRGALSGELLSGGWGGLTPLPGDRLPASREGKLEPTEAWLGVNWNHIAELRGGLMGSSWGNGLVARDGRAQAMDQQWFYVPTVGDRVVRGALVLTPFRNTSSALRGLAVSFAVDRVFADDVLYEGDSASQLVGSVRWFVAEDQWLGLYYAGRSQTADSGRGLDVSLVDAAFDVKVATPLAPLRLQGEAALIAGTTTLAPSPDFAKHDVLQGAAQLRSTAQLTPGLRAQLDLAWLSGDANLGDGQVSAFKADPNAQLGIVLFPRVLAWQSGRARLTASDPNLVGQPPEDLDRLATGGALTNSWVVFPKLGHTFLQRGEVYGGALLAWTSVPLADPRWTVSEGAGSPRNFLGNAATSSLLGAEFDAGVRWRMPVPHYPAHLLLCAEAGVLLPGGALAGLNDPIPAGRVTLAWLGHEAP